MRYSLFVSMVISLAIVGCSKPQPQNAHAVEIAESDVKKIFIGNLASLEKSIDALDSLIKTAQDNAASRDAVQTAFRAARLAYKRLEFLAEYYAPSTSEEMNGAALSSVGEEYKIEAPSGFQVLEEFIFPAVNLNERDAMLNQTRIMRSLCKRLDGLVAKKPFTDDRVFDAMRLEIARMITLGVTGFDSPVAQASIDEANAAAQGIAESVEPYLKRLEGKDAATAKGVRLVLENAVAYLKKTTAASTTSIDWSSSSILLIR